MKNVRKVINEIMNDVLDKNMNLKESMDKRISDGGIKGPDLGLVKEEVYGTIRNLIKINFVIYKYNTIKKVDKEVLNILRTSVYEILFLDKIPEHATCNEAVNLTKAIRKKSAANFVNAVLRNVIRSKSVIAYPTKADGNMVEYLSVNYSMPMWYCEMMLDHYPVTELEELFAKMNEEYYEIFEALAREDKSPWAYDDFLQRFDSLRSALIDIIGEEKTKKILIDNPKELLNV